MKNHTVVRILKKSKISSNFENDRWNICRYFIALTRVMVDTRITGINTEVYSSHLVKISNVCK